MEKMRGVLGKLQEALRKLETNGDMVRAAAVGLIAFGVALMAVGFIASGCDLRLFTTEIGSDGLVLGGWEVEPPAWLGGLFEG